VQGNGDVTFEFNYSKSGGNWTWQHLGVANSSLPRGQEAVALRCMQNSVRGTSFATEGDEETKTSFVLKWTFPVPFPANATELTNTMFAARANNGLGGTGGCDGRGTQASCYTCDASTPECIKVCVGYSTCSKTYGNGTATCGAQGKCASGGPFGLGGLGVIMY
jgi:hypothetical protein